MISAAAFSLPPARRAAAVACSLLLAAAALPAQPPAGYYDTVDATDSTSLRLTLHDVIDDHVRFPYTAATTDTWDILNLADEDPNNTANIIDVYKNASYTKIPGGTGAYNREHTWPKSYGFPNDNSDNYPYTDCHMLFLSDSGYNSSRSNKPFRDCHAGCSENPTDFNDGRGGGSGVYPGNSNWTEGSFTQGTWETWNGRKGDVARAIFYMDIRYEGGFHGGTGSAEPDLIATDSEALIDSSNTGANESVAYMGMLAVLLQWHQQDPVDSREIWRNEVVYTYQGNRNPFIDHPEWVDCLFNNVCSTDTTPPAAPTGLAATPYDGAVDLVWNANGEGDLAGYNVYRATTAGGPYSQLNTGLVASASYLDATAVNGTTYYYVVTAVDTSSNESADSNEASATPDAGLPDIVPPAAPVGLAAAGGDGRVQLTWAANGEPDLAGYNVYRATTTGGPYSQLNGALVATAGYTDTAVTNGTTYFYVVTAVDTSSNESADSNETAATPAAPNATGVVLSEVFYNAPSGDDGFEWVELHNSDSNPIDLSGYCLGNGGTDYTYSKAQLSGTIAAGGTFVVGGPSSDAGNANPVYDLVLNFNPDFQNSGATADGVALFDVPCASVTAGTVPVDAVVYGGSNANNLIDETGSANPPEVGDSGVGSSIERVDMGGAWQVQSSPTPNVAASGVAGAGDVTAPAAPAGLGATAGDGQVDLTWAANGEGDLDGYNVHRATTAGGPYTQLNGTPVASPAYTDTAVTNGTTYYYVVSAVDTSGNESGTSGEASATPSAGDVTPPSAPTGLAATGGDGQVDLTWDPNGEGDLDGYNVHRATTAGGPYTQLNGAVVASAAYTDTAVTNGTTYYYVVSAVDTSGNESGTSSEASATPTAPGGEIVNLAASDFSTFRGTVIGSYLDTHAQDDIHQQLVEGLSGGKPANRHSTIEHVWTFDVAAGVAYTFEVDAHHTVNSEGDDFLFYYSRDDVAYTLMLTVTKTVDDDVVQSFVFPEDVAGTLYILATDTDRTAGNQVLDSLFVDQMRVVTDTGGGSDTTPPAAPTGLTASGGDGSVGLDWADNTEPDLAGYDVHRSTTPGGPYTQINGSLVTTSDYVDNGVVNGTTYHYVVTAVDSSSNVSADSNEASATPQAGGATTLHVASIVPSTVGGGKKKGRAVVAVVDNLGAPVTGAQVSGTFSGDFNETAAGTTDGSGAATLDTSARKKEPISFTFCVDSISHGSLTYDPASNVETCDGL